MEGDRTEELFFRASEVAIKLGCCKSHVYKLYSNGTLKGVRLSRNLILFSEEEVNRIINSWKDENYKPIPYPKKAKAEYEINPAYKFKGDI